MVGLHTIGHNKFLVASWLVQKMTLLFFKGILSKSIIAVSVKNSDLEIRVNSNNIYPILYFLQKHTACQFDCLTDIVCYDTPGKHLRFGIIYNLLSVRYNTRLRLTTKFRDLVSLFSVSSIFSGAGWMEREVLDMFGIYFFLNKDLRKILTDYNFAGYPLRKDFPLTGYIELFYDDNQKRVAYQLVELTQEYRNFNFRLA
jgi:NADH:ubiquinone oxidoreductase subunit C